MQQELGRSRWIGRASVMPLAAALLLGGCGSSGPRAEAPPADLITQVNDKKLATSDRVAAVERFWAQAAKHESAAEHEADRESLKTIAWKVSVPQNVRMTALRLLTDDERDEGHADSRKMLALMLPPEPDSDVVAYIARTAAARGWKEYTPMLVRTYAKKSLLVPDEKRPEREAIIALHPERTLEQSIFAVFATPVDPALKGAPRQRAEDARMAAWELLSRLDRDGSKRAAILRETGATASNDPLVADLRACSADLRAIPVTGSQLKWLRQLRDFGGEDGKAKEAWWRAAGEAVAKLPVDHFAGWQMRHAEPVRWASKHRPEWVAASRDALLNELTTRLHGRVTHTRGSVTGFNAEASFPESLAAWRDKLAWGDVLAALIADEALRTPGLAAELFAQVERDRKDESTEYGGLLESTDFPIGAMANAAQSGMKFVATVYPPRATARFGDTQFVASDDMLTRGSCALAHYHFHAQRAGNADHAGPGEGDRDYATDQGRFCLVFTSIDEGTLDVDFYFAGGFCIDLGEIRKK